MAGCGLAEGFESKETERMLGLLGQLVAKWPISPQYIHSPRSRRACFSIAVRGPRRTLLIDSDRDTVWANDSSLRVAFHLERHHLLVQFGLLLLCAQFDQQNQPKNWWYSFFSSLLTNEMSLLLNSNYRKVAIGVYQVFDHKPRHEFRVT